MRKIILLLTAVICLCMANKTMAYNFSAINNGKTIYYNITSSSAPLTVEVTYATTNYNSYSGAVVIPSTVNYNSNTYSVSAIGERAFSYCSGLPSVTIPNSVTSIGSSSFAYCSGLTTIYVKASTPPVLGSSAFSSTTLPVHIHCGTISAYQNA